jgi:sortase A
MRLSRQKTDRLILRGGIALLLTGYLIFSFVGYTLWGTGLAEQRAQRSLEAEFAGVLASAPPAVAPLEGGDVENDQPAEDPREVSYVTGNTAEISAGRPLAMLWIPKLSLEKTIVHGTRFSHLKTGPGHFEKSAMFGHTGNAAIAGHRTTYGSPFERLDELVVGDSVWVRTLEGQFQYRVTELRVVQPAEVAVVAQTEEPLLTLVTCHPKYSSSSRLIVRASLVGETLESASQASNEESTFVPVQDGATATTTVPVRSESGGAPSVTQPQLSDAEWGGWNQDVGAWWLVMTWGSLMLTSWRFAYLVWQRGRMWRGATLVLVVAGCAAQWLWCAALTGIAPNSL